MASLTDKVTDTRNAARPNSARATGTRASGGSSLACDNLAGWPTASKVHFVTYQVDSSSNPVAGTQLDCYGIVSGNSIGSFTVVDGTDTGNVVGDYVEMLPTAAWGQDLSDALTSTHNRSGGLKTGITVPAPVIADFTSANHNHSSVAQGGKITAVDMSVATITNPYKFHVTLAGAVTTGNPLDTYVTITFDTEQFDSNGNHSGGTYTAPVNGFYHFNWAASWATSGAETFETALFVNGTLTSRGGRGLGSTVEITSNGSDLLQLNAADTVTIRTSNSGARTVLASGPKTYFSGFLVSQS